MLEWTDLAEGKVPGDSEDDPCQPKIGWQKRQRTQSRSVSSATLCGPVWVTASVPLPFHKVLWRVSRSFVSPSTAPGASIRSRFVFCSFVASVCPFPGVSAVAGVVVLSTLLAITRQLARTRGFGVKGVALESAAARVCRGECALTRSSTTWSWVCTTSSAGGRVALHGGIDTTMVSPLHRNGVALRRASSRPGVLGYKSHFGDSKGFFRETKNGS